MLLSPVLDELRVGFVSVSRVIQRFTWRRCGAQNQTLNLFFELLHFLFIADAQTPLCLQFLLFHLESFLDDVVVTLCQNYFQVLF